VVGCTPNIHFVDTPAELRAQYQYFTRADVTKLRHAGFDAPFYSLEDGVRDYLTQVREN
jgi:ADP-L-glycero-D-manno-heptose 6-epimerase